MQRIAVIGTGMVAKAHLQSIVDLSNKIRLAGVVSRSKANAENFARQASQKCGYNVSVFDNMEALCADGIDWTIVLTPPNARLEVVSELASAGISILLEKPIERNLSAARKIVEICEHGSVSLGVVFQHRMRQASLQIAKLVGEGTLGKIGIVEVIVPWWRDQSYYDEPGRGTHQRDGGGVLISQAIHSLDLMLSLTGRVAEVQAMASTSAFHQMEAEDYVTAALKFENGAVGSLIASTSSFPGDAESITLHCSNGVARLQSGELHLNWRDGKEERLGEIAATGGGADPMAFTHDWHRDVIEDFSDAYSEGRAPVVTGREGLEVHALIDALVNSSQSKSARVVPLLDD